MSTKRSTPLDDPPSASSDESETDDEQQQDIIAQKTIQQSSGSEELESESDSEEGEEQTPNLAPVKTLQTQNPNSKPSESSSSSESDSESESNENPKTKTLTVTPTKSSSIFEFESDIASPSASDFAIKPSKKISAFETPEKKPTKRHALASDDKDKKKAKILNGDTEDGKKSAFKRVWSDEDEIMLLQGFLDYQKDNGCSPLSDMDGFYRYSMNFIPGNATKSQLYEKVRRLKKKFRVNSEKVGPNGEDPTFVKPHEGNMFKLMKKIWGVDGCETVGNVGGSTAKSEVRQSTVKASKVKVAKVKPKMEVEMDDVADDVEDDEKVGKVEDFETVYPYWFAGLKSEISASLNFPAGFVDLVKESFNLIGEDKAIEMNEYWKSIFEKEAVLRKKRIAFMCDVVRPLL